MLGPLTQQCSVTSQQTGIIIGTALKLKPQRAGRVFFNQGVHFVTMNMANVSSFERATNRNLEKNEK